MPLTDFHCGRSSPTVISTQIRFLVHCWRTPEVKLPPEQTRVLGLVVLNSSVSKSMAAHETGCGDVPTLPRQGPLSQLTGSTRRHLGGLKGQHRCCQRVEWSTGHGALCEQVSLISRGMR